MMRSDKHLTSLGTALLAAALVGFLPACLGGDGKAQVDAMPQGDAPDVNPDASPDGGAPSACAIALADAPRGADAPGFTDALPTATVNTWDGATIPGADDPAYPGGTYRTLTPDANGDIHPGCSTAGLGYTPATIAGYPCAAKEYAFPQGVEEDTTKPIVLLMHGNSDSPSGWEPYLHPDPGSLGFPADTEMRDQLSTLLPAAGYRTIAVDYRVDLVDDPTGDNNTANAARNVDHGWAVPIAQELIKRVIDANPERKVSIVGFSLGATVVRDALRRLYVEYREGTWEQNVFAHLQDVVVAAGANHGVSTGLVCGNNTTMRGTVTCEMGQRNQYTQTEFHAALNGPSYQAADGKTGYWYETPCADGDYAFGQTDACGGNQVAYTSITMQDLENGTQQDLFVSEYASRMYPTACANNVVDGLNDFDTSGYFLSGLFRNHYGSVRSVTGLNVITSVLAD